MKAEGRGEEGGEREGERAEGRKGRKEDSSH